MLWAFMQEAIRPHGSIDKLGDVLWAANGEPAETIALHAPACENTVGRRIPSGFDLKN